MKRIIIAAVLLSFLGGVVRGLVRGFPKECEMTLTAYRFYKMTAMRLGLSWRMLRVIWGPRQAETLPQQPETPPRDSWHFDLEGGTNDRAR